MLVLCSLVLVICRSLNYSPKPFLLAVAITLLGALCGGALTAYEPEAKEVILPFSHLQGDPSERVAKEERAASGNLAEEQKGEEQG